MECEIVQRARALFLSLGFKSVTMDDIAQESGVSKKTIYQHFKNKTELVEECVTAFLNDIFEGVSVIQSKGLNAVEEQIEIKKVVMQALQTEKTSPHMQLEKYYPDIYKKTRARHFEIMGDCVSNNIKKGIAEGLYRSEIDVEIVTKMHFICAVEMKNHDIFPPDQYSLITLMNIYIENYLRSIVTLKGLEILEQLLKEK